jgi:sialic acid synthase SpsE
VKTKKKPKTLLRTLKDAQAEVNDAKVRIVHAALKRGGFVCPGCGSPDLNSHSYDCVAALVAAHYGLTLIEVHILMKRRVRT